MTRVRNWIVEREPAMSAALLLAIGVVVDQVNEHGLSWQVVWGAVPLALGAAVRAVVANKRTVAELAKKTGPP